MRDDRKQPKKPRAPSAIERGTFARDITTEPQGSETPPPPEHDYAEEVGDRTPGTGGASEKM